MRTLKLTIAYDGTDFAGWQFQPRQRTVQQTLQDVLKTITGETITVTASGRTDAGVRCARASRRFLDREPAAGRNDPAGTQRRIAPRRGRAGRGGGAPGFHAIRDALRKRYRYVLRRARGRRAEPPAGLAYLSSAGRGGDGRGAAALVGRHDFRSFETAGSRRTTTVRTVHELSVCRQPAESAFDAGPRSPDVVRVEVMADGFLYNMVRNIVGTLVEVGRGVRDESWPAEVLAARDRRAAGPTAPPQGLFLVEVEYETGQGGTSGDRSRRQNSAPVNINQPL